MFNITILNVVWSNLFCELGPIPFSSLTFEFVHLRNNLCYQKFYKLQTIKTIQKYSYLSDLEVQYKQKMKLTQDIVSKHALFVPLPP